MTTVSAEWLVKCLMQFQNSLARNTRRNSRYYRDKDDGSDKDEDYNTQDCSGNHVSCKSQNSV